VHTAGHFYIEQASNRGKILMSSQSQSQSVQKLDDINIGEIVVKGATSVVKNRPVTFSFWVLGLLLAAFAKGFSVDDATRESYTVTLQMAEEVDRTELNKALSNHARAEQAYRQNKGWFSCDSRCMKFYDKERMAQADVDRVMNKRNTIMTEARREVGIWSVFGVQDIRDSFWKAWKSGKDFASRCTMYDALFMMMGSNKEETAITMILKVVMQYIMNLTLGLMGAFCFFLYNVYNLIVSYGESFSSGLAFFLLVLVAGLSTIGTYLFAIFGTVAAGGVYVAKQAAKQAELRGETGGPRRQIHGNRGTYGSGMPGGMRQHWD
jgi:hypothetical protein